MPSLVFNKCCGCIELKTGCFILGYINLVFTLIMIVFSLIAVAGGAVITKDKDKDAQEVGIMVMVIAVVLLILLILNLVFAIVLLIGLHKEKPGHLKAYLIYSVIFLVINIVQFIASLATEGGTATSIAQSILSILLSFYFILVIRSMYFQLKDPSRGPAIYSAA